MGRFRQVMLLAALALPYATGCAGLNEARHATMQSLGVESPAPAVSMGLVWQNQLSELPDPTKNGQTISGLPGQMFLFTGDSKAAVPTGDLTLTVIDETPRPQGVRPKETQTWHFGKDKLEKMVSIDEHWSKNIVLFIPFLNEPGADWRDVSRVRIKARYDQTVDGKPMTLYAQETQVTIDFVRTPDMGVWRKRPPSSTNSMVGVPDPNQVLSQMRAQEQQRLGNQPQQQNVIPAGGFPTANPPQGQVMMQGQGTMQGSMQGNVQGQGSVQPQWTVQTSKQPMPNQAGAGQMQPVQWPTQSTQQIPQGLQVQSQPMQVQPQLYQQQTQPWQQQPPAGVTGNGFVVPNLPPVN